MIIGSAEDYDKEIILKILYKTRLDEEGSKLFKVPERNLQLVPYYEEL